jgi:2-polyprenyl-3-methyl-5-hydroxy-6-metoxy-1,4-benzoquinol methylase
LQFCKHFLAPLALMCHRDPLCGKMLSLWIDGLPLELASALLPWKTRLFPMLQLHIHMHARMQRRHGDARKSAEKVRQVRVNENTVPGLCESLRSTIGRMSLPGVETEWGDYYNDTNYSDAAASDKARLVDRVAASRPGGLALDLGANAGVYSRILAEHFSTVIAADMDYIAVEKMYAGLKRDRDERIVPLILDLSNPSPALGWANEERESFAGRCQADLATALALIHHLTLGAGIPLTKVAKYFASLVKPGGTLVLEFVPAEDSQVRRLMAAREMVFADYTLEGCRAAFGAFSRVVETLPIAESSRCLLVLERF